MLEGNVIIQGADPPISRAHDRPPGVHVDIPWKYALLGFECQMFRVAAWVSRVSLGWRMVLGDRIFFFSQVKRAEVRNFVWARRIEGCHSTAYYRRKGARSCKFQQQAPENTFNHKLDSFPQLPCPWDCCSAWIAADLSLYPTQLSARWLVRKHPTARLAITEQETLDKVSKAVSQRLWWI